MVKVSPGLQMHYIIPSSSRGASHIDPERPTVILLHPRFFDLHFFGPQYRDSRLAKGYNLIAIDHHYHGKTTAPLDDKPYNFQKVKLALSFL
jgi:pimeloyl-ACP methyl ester carboxylesterase